MSRSNIPKLPGVFPPWFTEEGIDPSLYPIEGVLRQALSPNEREFQSGCSLLKSMCMTGRIDAGIFLLGLIWRHSNDYPRLTWLVDALESFERPETVQAFASELRRVKGSSLTRGYLRRIIMALGRFPRELAGETIEQLSSDPMVGAKFRQHLKDLTSDGLEW